MVGGGGLGFPIYGKWVCPTRLLVVNAEDSEPTLVEDRSYCSKTNPIGLEADPQVDIIAP
ncbi:MAG: hypothetical protein ACE5JU_12935 [Candidatus Binatia bacterium]